MSYSETKIFFIFSNFMKIEELEKYFFYCQNLYRKFISNNDDDHEYRIDIKSISSTV